MKETFGDDYYDAVDVDPEFGSDGDEDEFEKPDLDKEDELLGLPKGWDEAANSGEGFNSTRQKLLKERGEGDDDNTSEYGSVVPKEGGKRKRKPKPSDVEKAVREELMEVYYKLNYEDSIGDLKTRFKYKQVDPKRYGLAGEEILMIDEKELNQYVSLKKLAPYGEEWNVPRNKTFQFIESQDFPWGGRMKTKNRDKATKEVVNAVEADAESKGDTSTLSRQDGHKLVSSYLRRGLAAYWNNPPKSKSKNKNI